MDTGFDLIRSIFRSASWGFRLGFSKLILSVSLGLASLFGLERVSQPSSVSCEAAYQLSAWSWKKLPSHKPKSLSDAAFARKVLARYVELMDPNKTLFLESEVEAFYSQALGQWEGFTERRDCSAFGSWTAKQYPAGEKRLKNLITTLPLEKSLPRVLPKQSTEEKGYPYFAHFAQNEKELSARLMDYASALGETASEPQLDAFQGNRRAMVEFAMSRFLLAEEAPEPIHLLARAMVNSLDPFSDYFSDGEYSEFYRELVGGTSGVGVQVRDVPKGLLIQKIIPNSPAGRSRGLRPGDVIVAVDGVSLAGMPAKKLHHVLEGPESSPVNLAIAGKDAQLRHVRLVRQAFAFEDSRVESHLISVAKTSGETRYGVITIPSFYGEGGENSPGESSSAEDVRQGLLKLLKSHPAAIVLDLRGNPGGYLEEAVAMAGLFLGSRPVVAVVEPTMERTLQDFHAKPLYSGPLLVLVDDQSASAAEILAGALKDHQRAVVMGSRRTYGKGSVQRLFHLSSGLVELPEQDRKGVLKITTSFFYSPLGQTPANGGLAPHWVVDWGKKKDRGEERPQRSQIAPSHEPFLNHETVVELREKQSVMDLRVAALKESDSVRSEDIREIFEEGVKNSLGPKRAEKAGGAGTLGSTLAIAGDLAEMEQSQKVKKQNRL